MIAKRLIALAILAALRCCVTSGSTCTVSRCPQSYGLRLINGVGGTCTCKSGGRASSGIARSAALHTVKVANVNFNCSNCTRHQKTCWQHIEIERVCACGAEFVGTQRTKVCPICRVQRVRYGSRSLEEKQRQVPRGPKACIRCNADYMGVAQSKYCEPCVAQLYEDRKAAENAAYRAIPKLVKPSKLGSRIPPPCQQCHYCKETDQYPSGMVCLAEAFMRCKPWSLGAKPLKEKKSV